VTDRVTYHDALSAVRTTLDGPAFAHAWATGQAASLDETIADALRVARQAVSTGTRSTASDRCKGRLTRREHEVLRLVAAGFADREIAAALFISPRTVMAHIQHIFTKLGVRTRKAAVAIARELALV
jgi:DNA-binding NarL/FixJ family response regulator